MRQTRLTTLYAGFLLLALPALSLADTFCIHTTEELKAALETAATNQQNDEIRIPDDAILDPVIPHYETGYDLVIENGYDWDCRERLYEPDNRSVPKQPEFKSALPDEPQLVTSGPVPPPQAKMKTKTVLDVSGGAMTQKVLGVPAFFWHHGCGPTAAAMLLAYWDVRGMPNLLDGDGRVQSNVNENIASSAHYNEYSLPRDDRIEVQPDYSELNPANTHADNSIADFMHTSWSSENLRYGWTWASDVLPALRAYTTFRDNSYDSVRYDMYYWADGSMSWDVLVREIDQGRPMIFLVDSDADGWTDHMITAIGYNSATGEYAFRDTWSSAVRWAKFREMSTSYPWGIYGGWSYDPGFAPLEPPPPPDSPTQEETAQEEESEPEQNVEQATPQQSSASPAQQQAIMIVINRFLLK